MKKDLKKYYKRIELTYTIYDSNNYDLPIAQFDDLKTLYNYIINNIHKNYTFNSLKNAITKNYYLLDRFYIIKDKYEKGV